MQCEEPAFHARSGNDGLEISMTSTDDGLPRVAVDSPADLGDEIETLQMPDGSWVISDYRKFWLFQPAFQAAAAFRDRSLSPERRLTPDSFWRVQFRRAAVRSFPAKLTLNRGLSPWKSTSTSWQAPTGQRTQPPKPCAALQTGIGRKATSCWQSIACELQTRKRVTTNWLWTTSRR